MVRRKFLIDLWILLLEQLFEIRTTWYWHLLFAVVLPVAMVFGFARIGTATPSRESLVFIVSGAAIFAVVNDGLYAMAIRIGQMRQSGMLLYYATLPIRRTAFIIALMISRLLITMPGMMITLVFGSTLYHLDFSLNMSVILLLLFLGLTFSALGMTLGMWLDNVELIQVVVNLLLFVLIMATPVFIAPQALPGPLQVISLALPPTYAAAALRSMLTGVLDTPFYLNLSVLTAFMFLSFIWLERRGRWQL